MIFDGHINSHRKNSMSLPDGGRHNYTKFHENISKGFRVIEDGQLT